MPRTPAPSHFVPKPGDPTEPAEMIGGPLDGQCHSVNTGLRRINVPGQGAYIRQDRLRLTRKPLRVYRWKADA